MPYKYPTWKKTKTGEEERPGITSPTLGSQRHEGPNYLSPAASLTCGGERGDMTRVSRGGEGKQVNVCKVNEDKLRANTDFLFVCLLFPSLFFHVLPRKVGSGWKMNVY